VTLSAGTRLGPYQLVAPVGAGGMGEVYRAKDTRLDRTVAVKVLPTHLSSSPDSRQRFEREARTISQLQHPHICALYDVGHQDGVEFLVMEFLEGETLAERIRKGPLPFEEVLEHGIEIAGALEKAHRHGIVHRDLKPGNVMLTKSGVKLLDFGLAKAVAPLGRGGVSLTTLPTQVGNDLTAEGTILGTFQYMAPEQLEGKEADARTDIFAFGCVLYEMATGKKAFSGESQASLISAIMSSQPAPLSAVAPAMPPTFDRVVRSCLAKDPDERWQSASDTARQLEWMSDDTGTSPSIQPINPRRRWREALAWIVAAAAIGAAVVTPLLRHAPKAEGVVRFTLSPPAGLSMGPAAAISPDGSRIAFIAVDAGGRPTLWLRTLDGLVSRQLPGTENARFPFWSPDGRSIAFFSNQRLRRISAEEGAAQTICRAGLGFGGSWNRDGTIVFSSQFGGRIDSVPAAGGTPAPATEIQKARGDSAHLWPAFLPDGRHFVFTARNFDPEKTVIALGSLDSKETRPLFRSDSAAVYAAPGYLLFARESTLLAQKLSSKGLSIEGEAVPAIEGIRFMTPDNALLVSASTNGTMVYGVWSHRKRLVAVDRKGREVTAFGDVGDYEDVAVSADGRRLAISRRDPSRGQNVDIWVVDFASGIASRVTSDRTDELSPAWFPDGDRLAYVTEHEGFYDFSVRPASGGAERRLFQSGTDKTHPDLSSDGRFLVYGAANEGGFGDLQLLPLSDGARRPIAVTSTAEFDESFPAFSPDSKWLAYESDESGRPEVYVRRVPSGPSRRISTSGGGMPVWRRDGKELFFHSRDGMLMAVALHESEDHLDTAAPQPLFDLQLTDVVRPTPFRRTYESAPDGERFYVIRAADAEPDPVAVALHWTEMLHKR
jgi:eukaryotic-like serine/threonine-protein kinase